MTVYIDTNSYGALKKNINGSEPNFDPYFIDETTINFFGKNNNQVTIKKKQMGQTVNYMVGHALKLLRLFFL